MAARKRPSRSPTPIDEKQRRIKAEHESVSKKIDQIERTLANAPKIRADAERRRRNELSRELKGARRANDAVRREDNRFNSTTSSAKAYRLRPMKAERRQAQITFLGLCIGLMLLVIWLYSVWRW